MPSLALLGNSGRRAQCRGAGELDWSRLSLYPIGCYLCSTASRGRR